MNVLVIGGGGREHALCWKIAQSRLVQKVFCAPGNAGTLVEPKVENVAISPLAVEELLQFAVDHAIQLTVVGPEDPLHIGIVDRFRSQGLRIFGPQQYLAQLEASKSFAKEQMRLAGVPTAPYQL